MKRYIPLSVSLFVAGWVVTLSLSFTNCTDKRVKWYTHVRDSLSRLDFPPRQFDTLFYQAHQYGSTVDTVYPNGIHEIQVRGYKGNYECNIRHKDSLIWDILEYDAQDAKLIRWYKEFIWGGGIIGYIVEYLKDGNVRTFYPDRGWDYTEDGYVYPTYSIYQLIDKLQDEKFNLFHNASIYYGGWKYYNPDSTIYYKWGWCVYIKDTTPNIELNMIERLYDGQTGKLIDSARGKW